MKVNLKPVLDFGKMPIANAFLTPDDFPNEFFYNLKLGFDPKLKAIGLINPLPLNRLFHDHYAFYSSTSKGMQNHFAKTAAKLLPFAKKGLVIELGSNDGIMLEAWKKLKIPSLGIEPSQNVAKVSQEKDHQVLIEFFDQKTVNKILAQYQVSLVYAANTFCQFEDLTKYLDLITQLIGKKGVLVFEDPYFLDIYEKTSFDQIYDEHVWYFTLSFINNLLEPFGYRVFDCEHLDVHGGELRMYVGHQDTFPIKASVLEWLTKEKNLDKKVEQLETNLQLSKTNLLNILSKIKKDQKRVCGFGATSKATTIFNYCGIGPDLIPFVTDNTPTKIGKFYPGVHIPVVSQEIFEASKIDPEKRMDYAFLSAWNHQKEIIQYQSWYNQAGGKWLTHVPQPQIL